MKKTSAFTLLELLISITVIAILVAISLPFFSSVLENARSVTCQNNLKEMHKALIAYKTSNNDCIPAASNSADRKKRWTYDLYRFSGSTKIYECPCDEWAGTERGTVQPDEKGFEDPAYGYNSALGTSNGPFGPDRPIAGFKNPGKTIMIADVDKFMVGGKSASENNRIKERHNDKGNVLFLNGNVISDKREVFESSPDNTLDPYIFEPFKKSTTN